MSNTINRTPFGNINTNVATRTDGTRRSARGNAGNITKANQQPAVESKFKKNFYSFFDDLFKNRIEEKAPSALASKCLFPSQENMFSVERSAMRGRGIVALLKRAVPGIAKLCYPEDPISVVKRLRDALSKYLAENQRSSADVEREQQEEIAAVYKRLKEVSETLDGERESKEKQRQLYENERQLWEKKRDLWEKERQLNDDKIRNYDILIENLMEKERNRHTGRKGLPTQEFYRQLSKKEKVQFLSMFRRPIRGEGPSKGTLEVLLELEAGEISSYHWKEALKHQEKFGAGFPKERVIKSVNRVSFDLIEKVIVFLRRSENVQRLAYGSKQCKLSNGAAVMIDAVEANKTLTQLIADFIKEFDIDTCTIPDDERCPEKGWYIALLLILLTSYSSSMRDILLLLCDEKRPKTLRSVSVG